jgi:hypothetical protein
MIKTPIDYDESGYSYDPDNPTVQTERLCYRLNYMLDALKSNGAEIRMVEPADIGDSETYIAGLFGDVITPPEEQPTVETPTNTDMLLDGSIYLAINRARTQWLQKLSGDIPELTLEGILTELTDAVKASLNREEALYLSDGTPIYIRSGLIA